LMLPLRPCSCRRRRGTCFFFYPSRWSCRRRWEDTSISSRTRRGRHRRAGAPPGLRRGSAIAFRVTSPVPWRERGRGSAPRGVLMRATHGRAVDGERCVGPPVQAAASLGLVWLATFLAGGGPCACEMTTRHWPAGATWARITPQARLLRRASAFSSVKSLHVLVQYTSPRSSSVKTVLCFYRSRPALTRLPDLARRPIADRPVKKWRALARRKRWRLVRSIVGCSMSVSFLVCLDKIE
jgi:hypothetical protein